MDPKIVFSILMVITLVYFTLGGGSRLLKKKSHHYIVPPACENDPNWHPIEFESYKRQIFIKPSFEGENSEDIKSFIDEKFPMTMVEIESRNKWFVVNINESNFEDFHTLIGLFYARLGYEILGFCSNLNKPRKDYVVKADANVDHLIGTFRDNQNFGIYLPKSGTHVNGNISISRVSEIYFDSEIANLPLENT